MIEFRELSVSMQRYIVLIAQRNAFQRYYKWNSSPTHPAKIRAEFLDDWAFEHLNTLQQLEINLVFKLNRLLAAFEVHERDPKFEIWVASMMESLDD